MKFLEPSIGWWIGGVILVMTLVKWRVHTRYAASTTVKWLGSRRFRASGMRRLPFLVLIVALALTGLALMQPVIPYSQADVQSRGLDIVLLLDLSSSMQEIMGSGQLSPTQAELPCHQPCSTPTWKPAMPTTPSSARPVRPSQNFRALGRRRASPTPRRQRVPPTYAIAGGASDKNTQLRSTVIGGTR